MLTKLLLLSMVTACISYTVTEAAVFRSFRSWIEPKKFVGKLFHCGYCFGFWVAVVMESVFHVNLFNTWFYLDCFLAVLVIAWLSGFQWITMCCLMKFAEK